MDLKQCVLWIQVADTATLNISINLKEFKNIQSYSNNTKYKVIYADSGGRRNVL